MDFVSSHAQTDPAALSDVPWLSSTKFLRYSEGSLPVKGQATLDEIKEQQAKQQILDALPQGEDAHSLAIRQKAIERLEMAEHLRREVNLRQAYEARLGKVSQNLQQRNDEREFRSELRVAELREQLLEQNAAKLESIEHRRQKTTTRLVSSRRKSEDYLDCRFQTGRFSSLSHTSSSNKGSSRRKRDVVEEFSRHGGAEKAYLRQSIRLEGLPALTSTAAVLPGLQQTRSATLSLDDCDASSSFQPAQLQRDNCDVKGRRVGVFQPCLDGVEAKGVGNCNGTGSTLSVEHFIDLASRTAAAFSCPPPAPPMDELGTSLASPPAVLPPASTAERVAAQKRADLEAAHHAIQSAKAGLPLSLLQREPVPDWRQPLPSLARPPTPQLDVSDPSVEEAARQGDADAGQAEGETVQAQVLSDMSRRADLVTEMRFDLLSQADRAAAEEAALQREAEEAAAAFQAARMECVVGRATAEALQQMADELVRRKEEAVRLAAEAAASEKARRHAEEAEALGQEAVRRAQEAEETRQQVLEINTALAATYTAQTLDAAAQQSALEGTMAHARARGIVASQDAVSDLFNSLQREASSLGITVTALLDSVVQSEDNLREAAAEAAATAAHYEAVVATSLQDAMAAARQALAGLQLQL